MKPLKIRCLRGVFSLRVVSQNLVIPALLALIVSISAGAQSYSVVDLSTPGTSTNSASEAHGINSSGFVTGTWWDGTSVKGSQYVFLYTNETITDLGTLKSGSGGYNYAIGYGINGSGLLAGQGTTSGNYVYHAFLYTNGTMVDLDSTGGSWSSANAINQQGQIAGFFTGSSGQTHAFIYTNGAMLDLGTLSGGTYSSARGINDSGVIVGEYSDLLGNTYGFSDVNNIMSGLGALGGNYSSAAAVNNSGVIVGESTLLDGELRAFADNLGIMSSLGTLGGTNSSAQAINNGGEIAGYATDANEVPHAFVYSGSTMLSLDTVLPPGCPFTNLAYAYGINDAGQVCGAGYTTNGSYHAFLATPPVLSLTVSSNITVTAPTLLGAIVNYSVTAAGGCSAAIVTAVPPSGGLFPVGTNMVTVTASDLCGHTNTGSFKVTVNPPPPPLVLTAAAVSASGQFSMSVRGVAGQGYVVLVSTDLLSWAPLYTNILPGTWTNWSDPETPINAIRYYRALTQP